MANSKYNYLIQFFFGFCLLLVGLASPAQSFVETSGDANSIWQTIITFNTDDVASSYVLYKGFLSVYPYVWFYDISTYFGVDHFLFIRIYHAFLFAISAGVALPYTISRVLCVKNKLIPSLIFMCVLLLLTWHTHIYTALMIDLPSFAFYSVAMSLVVMWVDIKSNKKKYLAIFVIGISFGMVFSGSGQYALAGLILVAFFLYLFYKNMSQKSIEIGMLIPLTLGVLLPKYADYSFDKKIVAPMRSSGEWIPTGIQWFASSMSRMMDSYKYGFPSVNNRGKSIMMDYLGDDFNERYELIKSGGSIFSPSEYLDLITTYTFDFLIIWFTKLFLALSFDGGEVRISHLVIAYTAVFVCMFYIVRTGGLFEAVKSRNFYLGASVLSTIAAPVFLHIEMRYSIALIAYLICFATYFLISGVSDLIDGISNKNLTTSGLLNVLNITAAWFIFILICLSLYGAISETSSFEPTEILFKI